MAIDAPNGAARGEAVQAASPEAVVSQLEKILADPVFGRARRMTRFLRFIVEADLANRTQELKEYTFALEVYDRDEDFDPTTSSLIRVEAMRLRERLERYYRENGGDDAIVIEIAKGSYIPTYRRNDGFAERARDEQAGDDLEGEGGAEGTGEIFSSATPLALPEKPSIAVLAFENMSGDLEQDYFADGIAEDVITALSRFRSLFVIARNSSFTYKGQAVDITQVARELGVRYVVEGSVRKAGNRVRITAQLIDAASGNHLWADRFDGSLDDVFDLQDRITEQIVVAVEPEIEAHERERARRKPPESLDAWKLVQRGLSHYFRANKTDRTEAIRLFREAVALDPEFATAHAHLAVTLLVSVVSGYADEDTAKAVASARAAAEQAVSLDPNESLAHVAFGRLHIFAGEIEMAIGEMQTSIAINPNLAWGHYGLGLAYDYGAGQAELALPHYDTALRLSPRDPMRWRTLMGKGSALRALGRHDEAIAHCRQACQLPDSGFLPQMHLAAAVAEAGQMDEARAAVAKAMEIQPALSISFLRSHYVSMHETYSKDLFDSLHKAGLPEGEPVDAAERGDEGAFAAADGHKAGPDEHLTVSDKPSIAVLPFDNMSDDPEQEHFADGIVEDVITALSRFHSLFVIARNSTFTYKGSSVDIAQIASDLGVRYVVEGSVRKVGNRVRITAQLIDATTGNHLWAERFDGALGDVFDLQDRITEQIVIAVEPEIGARERERARHKAPKNLDAWDRFQHGRSRSYHHDRTSTEQAISLFQQAVALDSGFAAAHANLAYCLFISAQFGYSEHSARDVESARAAAELTVALDPDEPLAHYVLGRLHIFAGEIEMAVGDMQTTIAINPNFPLGHFGLGFAHYWGLGQAEQGLPHFDAALRLSPRDPLHWLPVSIKGSALRFLGRLDEAIAHCRQACRFPNGGFLPHMHLAAALAEAGQKDDARAAVNKAVGLEPALSIDFIRGRYIGIHETVLKSLLDSLRKAGLPEGGLPDSDQQVDAGARAAPVSTGTVSSPPALPEKPSVAVLAFDNFSDAPEQEFFADGITEDIITALSKFKGLFVIARNSSFTYKGSGTDVMRVARELGVRYVVEGSVRKAANKVRVTAQLVDGATGNHVWADRYDHESDDIFALQDEITEEIVSRLDTEVRSSEMDRARRKPPANLDAWELYQRGLWHRYKLTKEDNEEARNLFRKAVERDAAFASAHAGIARTCCAEINEGFGDTSAGWLEKGLAAGEKAVDLDDNDSYTHYALGRILVLAGQGKRAIAELEKSIALNSSNAQGYLSLGHALLWYGRAAEAIPRLDMAMRLSPYDPVLWAMQSIRATACIQLENYDEAATWAQIAVNTNPEQMWAHLNLAVALAGQERPDEAWVAIEAARRLKPDLSLSVFGRLLPHFHPEYLERYNNALRKLGLPPGGPSDGAERIDEVAPAAQAPKVEGGAGEPEERPTVSDEPSIAVLPFDNMSDDAEQEYFADGIAEDIITALSKISQMRVIARNSTFCYKGRELDPRQIAEELSVRYVLKGSIRSGGSRLRITTQMIDASDGRHIWADRFDRTIDDIFDIQDEITKEIVTALRVKLTDGEEARVLARGTNDIEAWQLCVRATELFLRFNSTDYLAARELAEKAVACDPNYAYAWATLGFTHWWDGRLGYTGDSDAKFARANECAERAVALDDTVSWAIGLGTMVAGSLGRHDDGVAMGRRGFELNPGNADARAFLAVALVRAGIYHEAVDHYRAAMALNPFYPNWYRNGLVRSLSVLGEFDEALAISDEILSTDPDFLQAWLQKAYIFGQIGRSGDAEKAIREVRRFAPSLRLDHVPGLLLIKDAIDMQRFLDSLRKAGLPE